MSASGPARAAAACGSGPLRAAHRAWALRAAWRVPVSGRVPAAWRRSVVVISRSAVAAGSVRWQRVSQAGAVSLSRR